MLITGKVSSQSLKRVHKSHAGLENMKVFFIQGELMLMVQNSFEN